MNRQEYDSKVISADEAAKKISSNSKIFIGHCASYPKEFERALVANKELYENVEISQMLTMSHAEYCHEGMERHFKLNTMFACKSTQKAVEDKRADFTPCFFYKIPDLFKERSIDLDAAIVQLSPPDEEGNCSYGLDCDTTKAAAESSRMVIAEINDQMPVIYGDNFINIKDIDYIIEASYPLPELAPPKIGEVEEKIGENCATLIEDGSTLQLGIGSIPDAVLMFLKDKKNLGIHTEMFSDGVVDLVEAGVINGSQKSIHKGEMVATFLMGSKKLYDFAHKNENVKLYPVEYVNNPTVIMKNHKMVSINSCIEVDFSGQVASESIGSKQISGVGGQVDYVRGAMMAENGKSIIAMPSTGAKGTKSRIVPRMSAGSFVTTSRNDVDYVVTEYGIAKLSGKTLDERARLLIEIAHPKFREQLMEQYEKMTVI